MTQKVLAYNPTLHLIESHISCYKIYTLTNPISNEIFYVGQTILSLQERLSGHISQTGASNRDKINYIKEILNQGEKPIIKEVETIHTKCYIDKASVNERENYWIKYYRSIGCTLLNIANPKNYEYQNYLSSIKKGETSYHYYLCGKTAGGYEVYDEQKLNADGFVLRQNYPPPPSEKYFVADHYYNPLENNTYRLKIGLPIIQNKDIRNSVITDSFPLQPKWTSEFAASIPPYKSIKVEMALEMQNDLSDFEPEPMELDNSDFEPDADNEPDNYESWDNSMFFLIPFEQPELYFVKKQSTNSKPQ